VNEERDKTIEFALDNFKQACEDADKTLQNTESKDIPLEYFDNLYAYVTLNTQQDVDNVMEEQDNSLFWSRLCCLLYLFKC